MVTRLADLECLEDWTAPSLRGFARGGEEGADTTADLLHSQALATRTRPTANASLETYKVLAAAVLALVRQAEVATDTAALSDEGLPMADRIEVIRAFWDAMQAHASGVPRSLGWIVTIPVFAKRAIEALVPSLDKIDLSDRKLTSLPAGIFSGARSRAPSPMGATVELRLANNRIAMLNASAFGAPAMDDAVWTMLRLLDLQNNPYLRTIEAGVITPQRFPSLTELNLSTCPLLETLPPAVWHLKKLRVVDLTGCASLVSIGVGAVTIRDDAAWVEALRLFQLPVAARGRLLRTHPVPAELILDEAVSTAGRLAPALELINSPPVHGGKAVNRLRVAMEIQSLCHIVRAQGALRTLLVG